MTNGRKRVSVTKGTSGMQAIGLAFALGARSIVLLGFDGTPGHWADGTPYAHPTSPPGPELLARATRRLTTSRGWVFRSPWPGRTPSRVSRTTRCLSFSSTHNFLRSFQCP